jgi:Zn-dependent metalloprotease
MAPVAPLHLHRPACILPSGLLRRVAAETDDVDLRRTALDALAFDARFRIARAEASARTLRDPHTTFARLGGTAQVSVYDQHHATTQTPGKLVRGQGQPPVADVAVDQAYDGLEATYDFYWSVFSRDSIDGAGMPIAGCVHFGRAYPNAFWDGAGHMFFGDGDGTMLTQTTAGLDVIGHELTHGVTQSEANLTYSGQSGALNESISDVFGSLVKQKVLGQDAAGADWLIGADIVGPALKPALRSMKDPGHANPHDDQPATMAGYVVGGDVHTNSGIPNHAFYVVATTYGGNAWEVPGEIWYAALCDRALRPSSTFARFARVTLDHAQRQYGRSSKEAHAVQAGWDAVQVKPSR